MNDAYYFHADCFPTKHRDISSLNIWFSHVSTVPTWVNFLIAARKKFVSALVLKELGHWGTVDEEKPMNNYQMGDKSGIFTLLSLNDNEIF